MLCELVRSHIQLKSCWVGKMPALIMQIKGKEVLQKNLLNNPKSSNFGLEVKYTPTKMRCTHC